MRPVGRSFLAGLSLPGVIGMMIQLRHVDHIYAGAPEDEQKTSGERQLSSSFPGQTKGTGEPELLKKAVLVSGHLNDKEFIEEHYKDLELRLSRCNVKDARVRNSWHLEQLRKIEGYLHDPDFIQILHRYEANRIRRLGLRPSIYTFSSPTV